MPDENPSTDTPATAATEAAARQYTDILDQLAAPHEILANALTRIHQADAVILNEAAQGIDAEDRAIYSLGSAFVLVHIARAAQQLISHELAANPATAVQPDSIDTDEPTLPAFRPQPVRSQFTASLSGDYLGMVGGREWLHVPGHGYFDITGWLVTQAVDRVDRDDPETPDLYETRGRIVSATPDHVLVIDDGGNAHALPRALILEWPDDARL